MTNNRKRYSFETPTQQLAFEIYCGLGRKRSCAKVAKQLKVSLSTIKNWSRAFHWKERAEEWDAAKMQSLLESGFEGDLDQINQYTRMVEAAQVVAMKNLTEGNAAPKTSELITLIEARLALDGVVLPDMTTADAQPYGQVIVVRPDSNDNGESEPNSGEGGGPL